MVGVLVVRIRSVSKEPVHYAAIEDDAVNGPMFIVIAVVII